MLDKMKRTYQGERAGQDLVLYLNGKGQDDEAGRRRITKIVEAFDQIRRSLERHPTSEWKLGKPKDFGLSRKPRGWIDVRSKPDELAAVEHSLLEQVSRYERNLTFGIDSKGDSDFSWGLVKSKDLDWEKEDWAIGSESDAVNAIVELSREKLLTRVQKCECGTWFFARFSHQHFCSSRCRSRHQQRSPEFKAMRREYMRKYYRIQKKNVK